MNHVAASCTDAASLVRFERAPRTQTQLEIYRNAVSATKQVRSVVAEVAPAFKRYQQTWYAEPPKSTANAWFMGTYLTVATVALLPIAVSLPSSFSLIPAFMLSAAVGGVAAALPTFVASKLHTRAVKRHDDEFRSRCAADIAARTPITMATLKPLIEHLRSAKNETQRACIRAQLFALANCWDGTIGNEGLNSPELSRDVEAALREWETRNSMPADPAACIGWIVCQANPLKYSKELVEAFRALSSDHAAVADDAREQLGRHLDKQFGYYVGTAGDVVAELDRASKKLVVSKPAETPAEPKAVQRRIAPEPIIVSFM